RVAAAKCSCCHLHREAPPPREPPQFNETAKRPHASRPKMPQVELRARKGRRMLATGGNGQMNIAACLARNAKTFGDRPGMSWGTSIYSTYAQWAQHAAAIAGSLAGLTPGDSEARIAIAMGNRPEYLEALFAIWHAGRVAVPINAKLHREEFRYILAHSGARVCITGPDLAETIAPLAGELPALERVVVTGDEVWRRWRAGDSIPLVDRAPD